MFISLILISHLTGIPTCAFSFNSQRALYIASVKDGERGITEVMNLLK